MASTGKGALLTDQHRRRQVSLAITADSQARRAWDATLDLNDLTGTQPIWKRTMLNLIQTWWRISEQAALAPRKILLSRSLWIATTARSTVRTWNGSFTTPRTTPPKPSPAFSN